MNTFKTTEVERLRISIRGIVQGVGFRPFVYRLANELQLSGWIQNTSVGVLLEVEGLPDTLSVFRSDLEKRRPPSAWIEQTHCQCVAPIAQAGDLPVFEILPSEALAQNRTPVLPDLATCSDCLVELFAPDNRRYKYPFINCTQCGSRYSIITALPYDRPNTTMASFRMCADCLEEYRDPRNRRFHAQPNACPVCGPQLQLRDADGNTVAKCDEAFSIAANTIREGKIIAVKGVGGYLFCVDATSESAVNRLRDRKKRKSKPFALMYPDLRQALEDCHVSQAESDLLRSPQAPIVLLKKKAGQQRIASAVSPGNPYLGVMLPYAPLFHLLLDALGAPIVATSGNRSGEPLCMDEQDALYRLAGIADFFLDHDRPIANRIDDSILRVIRGKPMLLRRARGYASLPIPMRVDGEAILAVGGHQKNTVALAMDNLIFTSPHIGDLSCPESEEAHRNAIQTFQNLYGPEIVQVACDIHSDYISTRTALAVGKPVIRIQHHYAHVLSCMAEHEIDGPCLGVAWDGTGLGDDGTLWGGEFLIVSETGYQRLAHFLPFPLPGGERAAKDPRRCALGVLHALAGDALFEDKSLRPFLATFTEGEQKLLGSALSKKLNCPMTSSAGRLFDAIASLLGICQENSFEGEAAMALEFAADRALDRAEGYPFRLQRFASAEASYCVDWRPMLRRILEEHLQGIPVPEIAAGFHLTMVDIVLEVARLSGQSQVMLTGGCFQNRHLLENSVIALEREGFFPFWHGIVPPNDGGLAVGQILGGIHSASRTGKEVSHVPGGTR